MSQLLFPALKQLNIKGPGAMRRVLFYVGMVFVFQQKSSLPFATLQGATHLELSCIFAF